MFLRFLFDFADTCDNCAPFTNRMSVNSLLKDCFRSSGFCLPRLLFIVRLLYPTVVYLISSGYFKNLVLTSNSFDPKVELEVAANLVKLL